MKAILIVDIGDDEELLNKKVVSISFEDGDKIYDNFNSLKPIHAYALKSAGHDYIIYERQYLYKNLEREYELLKKAREYESNISN